MYDVPRGLDVFYKKFHGGITRSGASAHDELSLYILCIAHEDWLLPVIYLSRLAYFDPNSDCCPNPSFSPGQFHRNWHEYIYPAALISYNINILNFNCACICMHKHANTCKRIPMHANAFQCMHMHSYACICILMHAYAFKCMHMHSCACIRMHSHACACIRARPTQFTLK